MAEDKDKRNRGTIEKRIRQLVEVFNENGLKTFFSCHGHLRDRNPYVIFATEPEIAYRLWETLCAPEWQGRLKLLWTVRPWFWDNNIPGFIMEAKVVGSGFLPFSKKLEQDIQQLENLIGMMGYIENKNGEPHGSDEHIEPSIKPAPAGILGLADRTPPCIGSDPMPAPIAWDPIFHNWIAYYQNQSSGSRWIIISRLSFYFGLKDFANQLVQLYYEGAISAWPESRGYFLKNRQILLMVEYKKGNKSVLSRGWQFFYRMRSNTYGY